MLLGCTSPVGNLLATKSVVTLSLQHKRVHHARSCLYSASCRALRQTSHSGTRKATPRSTAAQLRVCSIYASLLQMQRHMDHRRSLTCQGYPRDSPVVCVGDALHVTARVVNGDGSPRHPAGAGVKAQQVGIELVRDGRRDLQQQHICAAVVEDQLHALQAASCQGKKVLPAVPC